MSEFFSSKRIAVTGGAGFLGQVLVDKLRRFVRRQSAPGGRDGLEVRVVRGCIFSAVVDHSVRSPDRAFFRRAVA